MDRPFDQNAHDLRNPVIHDAQDDAEVVAYAERLVVAEDQTRTRRVRIGKRVVTEERTVTVTLRREELVLEEVDETGAVTDYRPVPGTHNHVDPGSEPAADIVLHEEQVELVTKVVPVERVRAYVDRVTTDRTFVDDLRHEVIEVERRR